MCYNLIKGGDEKMNIELYLVAGGFIVFDIITGIIKATAQGKLNSTISRVGLFNKLAEISAIFLSTFSEWALAKLNDDYAITILPFVVTYISFMELLSSLENIAEVNPKLNKFLKPYLDKLKKKTNDIENNGSDLDSKGKR